ncbi:hypothetical protein [Pseudomonas aeruginosa]|uniref:hypothetical protein n=1 Tax=Pseudomonas aeruginosa TaxID=287 RepID=UPI00163CBC5D|nr:hypothetical protein [Pseudomonas aeruginosa]
MSNEDWNELDESYRSALSGALETAHPAVEQAGGDERKLSDLGNELHNLSCSIVHENEKWAEQIGGIASELWYWPQARAALAQPSPKREQRLVECDACPTSGGCVEKCMKAPTQPSPAQAEAERPEVVARVVHSNPVVLGQCGPLNANDELMTVAQHAASVARWAEMFNRVEQERDAALARVAELKTKLAELEKQEPAGWLAYHFGGKRQGTVYGGPCDTKEEIERYIQQVERSDDSITLQEKPFYAAPVAQAQHSGPEEFSFEYRHPNGESHTVTVSRDQVINEMPDFLFEALCSKFCNCEPAGETNVVECCCDEYAEEFKLLAAAPC